MQPHFQSENVLNTKRATHSQSLENLSNAKLAPHPKFSENKQSAKRRSRSAENMSRQSKSTARSKSSEKVSHESKPGAQSKSTENMSCSKWSAHSHSSEKKSVNKHASEISPILEVSREENLVFRTPSAYQRRSVAKFTPNTSARRSLFVQSKVFPTLEELQHRLNGWLLKHGKNPTTFSHLQELVGQKVGDEDKENVVEVPKNAGSYEDLHILPEEAKPKLQISGEETDHLAREALQDLFKLIQEVSYHP
ncbi:unnamed protein product [Acanthoscelides obtectus]|uniref:Uncharacterized protein n=1 Tax=Acanthoscelides obtectus TaxID=200917 RepID=A0A9P0P7W5_ACAOB|nr:unnamed protein product [Acanthoscelides obtectus]CAK1644709.1 hypothetical protein AOBTE_LOCUS13927 [Acanthoscelides obtectus]